jgi:hypothetical protein
VESNHRWDRVAARLETVYMEVMAARGGQRLERVAG